MIKAAPEAGLTLESLPYHYGNAVAAVRAMGFGPQTPLPALGQLTDGVRSHEDWLKQQVDAKQGAQLVIFPSLQEIGVMGDSGKPGLVTRFDGGRGIYGSSTVYKEVWGQFEDDDPIHDDYRKAAWGAAILLNDLVDPRNPYVKANHFSEPGLVYTLMTLDLQNTALEEEQSEHSQEGRYLTVATLSPVVMSYVQRKLSGEDIFYKRRLTNLVHYGAVNMDISVGARRPTVGWIPTVDFGGAGMYLGYTQSNIPSVENGVRRKLDLPIAA